MEMEYSRSKAAQDLEEQAFEEFVLGLQMMSTQLEPLLFNFAWAAGQIAGDADAPARIRGMMAYAVEYHRFGMETATRAIEENGGVRVNIMLGQDGKGVTHRPGILVGLVGVEHSLPTGRTAF